MTTCGLKPVTVKDGLSEFEKNTKYAAGFIPYLGELIDGVDTADSLAEGDVLGAAGGVAAAALGLAGPLGDAAGEVVKKAAKNPRALINGAEEALEEVFGGAAKGGGGASRPAASVCGRSEGQHSDSTPRGQDSR